MERDPLLLIAFYNKKALGVRYLEGSLIKSGFRVYVLFLKNFNSRRPEPVRPEELLLLKGLVRRLKPGLIGLSVMSSLYLDSVVTVNSFLKEEFSIPVVWGGVYASMFPGSCLEHADFVLRGECEEAIVELSSAVLEGKDFTGIKNLAFKQPLQTGGSKIVINDLRPLCQDLDKLEYPISRSDNKFYIEGGRIGLGDPMADSVSYELSASRGCPFMCSYCCSINLKRMYAGCGKYLRFRSVASVIGELEEALANNRSIKVIHFWDEIFPDDSSWTAAFASQYKARIGLPFEIWAHPLRIKGSTISRLVDAGLYKVVMGIQSGSPRIRKDIFHRSETQEDILEAAKILHANKVPQIVYDFILRHPFESEDDIAQTYKLCTCLEKPFELQLHGLNFFPGADITAMAVKRDIGIMDVPDPDRTGRIGDIYKSYWGVKSSNRMINYWYSLIYLSQFRTGLLLSRYFNGTERSSLTVNAVLMLQKLYLPAARMRYLYYKLELLIRSASVRKNIAKGGRQAVQYNEGK
ncbi:MAG: radical SAM protein [Clostridiaceae bacterium]|nr:radical SAM protein [Clostridiaceae bacterium]